MVGKTLGPYEILESIGKGGMGAVYRARDKTLDREVAVKVLPAEFARDPDRLARFQQEARLLAGLNHRNIAAVHGLEHIDGIRFFVQELVDGHSLHTMIRERSLEIDEIIDMARQVADALETAHAKGVIHRDLKPDNIMVTGEGMVKVLDFGLARPITGEEEASPGRGDSTPTISSVRPEGVILGTAAYMSPDQARGRAIDARGDIWAFGCVLYEMLARKKAFEGDTLVDTISAVVRSDPDWDALPSETPPRLVALIRRCLRKKLRDRAQHAGDLRIELTEIGETLGERVDAGGPGSALRQGFPFAAVAGAALGAAAMGAMIAALLLQLGDTPPPPPFPVHATLSLPEGTRLLTEPFSSIAIAPDGEKVVYTAMTSEGYQLFLQDLGQFEASPIEGTEGATNPFFSWDGRWIGFFLENRSLMKVPVDGGAPFEIAAMQTGANGGTWLPDDTIVYSGTFTGTGLTRVSASGAGDGEAIEILQLDGDRGEDAFSGPQAISGNRLLFTSLGAGGAKTWLLDLETLDRRQVLQGANDALFVEPDKVLFSRDGDLFVVDVSESGDAMPAPTLLFEGLFSDELNQRARFAVANNGTLVYMPGEAGSLQSRLVWVDRSGDVTPLPLEPAVYGRPVVSPDGRTIAYDRSRGSRSDIWTYDLEGNRTTRITDDGYARMPVWSPDGRYLMFASNREGPSRIYNSLAGGGGTIFEILKGEFSLWPRSWRNDPSVDDANASAIAYYEMAPTTGRDIWLVQFREGMPTEPRPFQNTPANEKSPMISPDGRWIAYVSNTSGRDEVYVQEVSGGQRTTISTDGGREPVWSRDGTEIFYRSGNRMMAVPISAGEQFEAGRPQQLFTGEFVSRSPGFNQYYDIDPSGDRFLMIQNEGSGGDDDHLHIVVHFAETALGVTAPTGSR
jgi:Tol biopolymer transport system component